MSERTKQKGGHKEAPHQWCRTPTISQCLYPSLQLRPRVPPSDTLHRIQCPPCNSPYPPSIISGVSSVTGVAVSATIG